MAKVEALEEEIKKLSREELVQLREWLLERDAQEYDRQIEQDAASDKLDKTVPEIHRRSLLREGREERAIRDRSG